MVLIEFPACREISDPEVRAVFILKAIQAATTKTRGLSVRVRKRHPDAEGSGRSFPREQCPDVDGSRHAFLSAGSRPPWHAVGDCYLMQGTFLKDLNMRWVPVGQLERFSMVSSASGRSLKVMIHQVIRNKLQHLVSLQVGDALLHVTASHRIVVRRGGQHVPAPARSLRLGDDIVCSLGVRRLDAEPEHHRIVTDVVQIRFDPDDAVEAAYLPMDIPLTLGERPSKRRHRWQQSGTSDGLSIPNTVDDFA